MQQLVSYQTAKRIYGERSYKKYVTKRTCISLTFSIGFFTLILGFLLGKFVSHRQYKLRQLYEPEVIELIRKIPQFKHIAENVFDNRFLESSITHFNNGSSSTSVNNSVLSFQQINSNLLKKMAHCGQRKTFNLLIDSKKFIALLLDDEVIQLLNCLKEVNVLLDSVQMNKEG